MGVSPRESSGDVYGTVGSRREPARRRRRRRREQTDGERRRRIQRGEEGTRNDSDAVGQRDTEPQPGDRRHMVTHGDTWRHTETQIHRDIETHRETWTQGHKRHVGTWKRGHGYAETCGSADTNNKTSDAGGRETGTSLGALTGLPAPPAHRVSAHRPTGPAPAGPPLAVRSPA